MNRIDPATASGFKPAKRIRIDLQLVADLVAPNTRVLDVGCGDGTLLAYLAAFKQVDGRGLEISMAKARAAVSQGLSVIQGNLETDLKDYPAGAFDYAILSQTLQATHNPRAVLGELLRIAKRAIVSFPNFGHWHVRWSLLVGGRMPMTPTLPERWYDTPNIHLCTILDFVDLCADTGVKIEQGFALDGDGLKQSVSATGWLANLFGQQAVFVLTKV
ncbi:MAG: methionine biosynthesis protein MetW [Rhodospirillaceae bacterium]|nr:methionine biosynthesis protein MetW [Rhodospirillaceae bacterium]